MPRAYAPRLTTIHLMHDIRAIPGVEKVRAIPGYGRGPTRLRITLEGRDGWGESIYTDMTLPEARAWLASEKMQVGA